MPRNNSSSQLWNYFDRKPDQKQATCRVCNHVYSYYSTTGNLKIHLRRVHPEVYARIDWERNVELTDNEGMYYVVY